MCDDNFLEYGEKCIIKFACFFFIFMFFYIFFYISFSIHVGISLLFNSVIDDNNE